MVRKLAKNVTDRDLGLKAFIRQLEEAKVVEVTVGIHENVINEGQSVAFYGAANEFGTRRGIPERSFMRSSFDENKHGISVVMGQQFAKVKRGEKTVRAALEHLGLYHKAQIQNKIRSNIQPGNDPQTIKRKKSSRTLIDTGAMLNSVHYVVRGKS